MATGAPHRLKGWAVLAWVCSRMLRKLWTSLSQSITHFTFLGSHRMGTLHSRISAKQGCVSWGLEAFGENPRWDTPRGICLLQEEERCPLGTIDHMGMAQHAILNALGHISRVLWIRWSSEVSPRRLCSPALRHCKFPLSLRRLDSWLSNSPELPERLPESLGETEAVFELRFPNTRLKFRGPLCPLLWKVS